MISVDRKLLVREIVAAVREDAVLRAELVAALGLLDVPGGMVSPTTYARQHELGVSTVRRAIREGRLACTRIGRSVRVASDAVISPPPRDTALRRAEARLGLVSRDGRR